MSDVYEEPTLVTFQDQVRTRIADLTKRIDAYYQKDDIVNGIALSDSLYLFFKEIDLYQDLDLSKPLYFLGVWENFRGNTISALEYLDRALASLKSYPDIKTEARIFRFKGILYSEIQDYYEAEKWYSRRLMLERSREPQDINDILESMIYLSLSKITLRQLTDAEDLIDEGLGLLRGNTLPVSGWNLFYLYQTRANIFIELSNYRRALQDLIKALEYVEMMPDDGKARLHTLFAICYFYTGDFEKCRSHYRSALIYSEDNPGLYIDVCSGYATVLGEIGDLNSGERVLEDALTRMRSQRDLLEDEYYLLLKHFAEYLRDYKIDIRRSLALNLECYRYLSGKPNKSALIQSVLLSYSRGLSETGNQEAALDSVNSILRRDVKGFSRLSDRFDNPDYSLLEPDKRVWYLLVARYEILRNLYSKTGDTRALEAASDAAGLAALMMERIKGNIGEEESRIFAGNRYRRVFTDAIDLYARLYSVTGSMKYLEKAFGFSERSKASGLLASTRKEKALKLSVPPELVELDNSIDLQIGLCKARILAQEMNEVQDNSLIRYWNNQLLSASERKDSLEKEIERRYPEYSRIKSDTSIIKPTDIKLLTTGKRNFISYVVTDSSLYIFLINSKTSALVQKDIDSTFYSRVAEFRHLLSEPDRNTEMARIEYMRFRELGRYLFLLLIDPVKDLLLSEKIIISPDNMLSYFPFDILLTSGEGSDDIFYKSLPFMMNDYSVSYAYSATLLGESGKTRPSFRNSSVSFAPSYGDDISVRDLLLTSRQLSGIYLSDLRFAREEAGYVSELTRGTLYEGEIASEESFIREAPANDIIHLAMHTILDAKNHNNSRMIFSVIADSSGDGALYTYEVNSLMLDARMVVLSSCFTGSGALFAGEGVLSLARAFLNSGSRSVVMSLWEVNDRSGTDIVKSFYRYLRKGDSKSNSLRKSRLEYLDKSDQLQSHPYFWSTLVVYGDDSPVYIGNRLLSGIAILMILLITAAIIFYLRKRS